MENALFCHRCGKAQRDLVAADENPPAVAQAVLPPPPPLLLTLPVNFRNPIAVRIGFLVASVASVLDAMPKVNLLFIIWSVSAGFVAVLLYNRATGQSLSLRDGARLGWIAGALNSLILMVLLTISMVTSSADLTTALREQVKTVAPGDANAMALVESPYAIAIVMLFTIFFVFVVCATASIAGGALGARITRDESRSQTR